MGSQTLVLFYLVCIWGVLGQFNGYENCHHPAAHGVRGHNDIHSSHKNIEYPCPHLDLGCIRNYFKEHSQCRPSDRAVPNPYYRRSTRHSFSNSNTTVTLTNKEIGNLNGHVLDFYVSPKTDEVVMVVQFESLKFYSHEAYFKVYREGQEPTVAVDYFSGKLGSSTITLVIPNIANLQLNEAVGLAYIQNSKPELAIGPKITHHKDPAIRRVAATILSNVKTMYIQHFQSDNFYISTFLQYNICDFGLRL